MADEDSEEETAKQPKGLPRPSEKDVTDFAASMKTRWGDFWLETAHRRALRFRTAEVDLGPTGIPEAFKAITTEVRTPDLQYNAQQAQALVLSSAPQPVIQAGGEKASKAEKWLRGALARVNEAKAVCSSVTGGQICSGLGIYCSYPRRDAWPDYPIQGKAETDADWDKRTEEWKKSMPFMSAFVVRSVPVDTVAFREDDLGICKLVEVKKVNRQELIDNFRGAFLNETTSSGIPLDSFEEGRDVEVTEYWDRQWRVVYAKSNKGRADRAGGHVLDVWEHKFGKVPYFIAESYNTGEILPLEKYIPLLWPMYAEAEENNRLHTMRTAIAHFTAFPFYYIRMKETQQYVLDETTHEPKVFHLVPGEIPQVPAGGEIVPVPLVSGFDLQAALGESNARMKEFALPPIATGNAPSGESAGWNTAMLRRFLITLVDPLVVGRARALAEMFRFWLKAVKYDIGEKVYVLEEAAMEAGRKGRRGEPIGLGPDDIDDWDVDVYISPDPQLDAVPLEQHGLNLKMNGGASTESFLRDYRRLAAPEEEMAAMDADAAYQVLWPAQLDELRQIINQARMPQRIAAGETPAAVVKGILSSRGVGKGSPGQPREPGVGMPVAPPIGESPTFTPPGVPGAATEPGPGGLPV